MAFSKYVAIVKLDPVETNSTGGVVEWVGSWEVDEKDNGVIIPQPYQDASGVIVSGYKAVVLSEHNKDDTGYPFDDSIKNPDSVKVGWILQDKTNILRDPNS